MSKSAEELFICAPEDATHAREYDGGVDFYKRVNDKWLYHHYGEWRQALGTSEAVCIERPKQPQAWSGDGLPPVGEIVEWRYAGSAEWKSAKVLYIGDVYVIVESRDSEQHYYLQHMEFRAIPTAAQLRESAIRELMDIAQVDCRVTAARLVDAGFKREGI